MKTAQTFVECKDFPGIKLLFRDQIAEIYDESVKHRTTIVPAVEKIIAKELPVLSARMKRLDA